MTRSTFATFSAQATEFATQVREAADFYVPQAIEAHNNVLVPTTLQALEAIRPAAIWTYESTVSASKAAYKAATSDSAKELYLAAGVTVLTIVICAIVACRLGYRKYFGFKPVALLEAGIDVEETMVKSVTENLSETLRTVQQQQYSEMTRKELRAEAKRLEVKVNSKLNKQQLISALIAR